jgi:hypothetical protein
MLMTVAGQAMPLPFEYNSLLLMLSGPVENKVGIDRVLDTPITYRVWGTWAIARPSREVASVALDFPAYSRTFRDVYKCVRITTPPVKASRFGTWYVEGRAMRVRIWSIGDIDSISCGIDSTKVRFFAHQNENFWLEKQWQHALPWWMNYRTHGLRMAAFVVARGHDSCSVGVVVQGWVNSPMPQWLIKLAAHYILPRLFRGLEAETERRFPRNKVNWFRWW